MHDTTWTNKTWAAFRARSLKTALHRDVVLRLRTFRSRGGIIAPSHEMLAHRARCSIRTVARALNGAAAAGLIRWSMRRKRLPNGSTERTSNLYELTPKNGGNASTGQIGRAKESEDSFYLTAPAIPLVDRVEAQQALAKARAVLEERAKARLLRKGWGRLAWGKA